MGQLASVLALLVSSGLAVVEAIASAHGWSVSMEAGSNGGARVVFGDVDVVDQESAVARTEQD